MAEPDKKAQQDIHLKIKANKNHSFFTSVLSLKNKNIVKLHQYVKTAKPLELPLRYHWVKEDSWLTIIFYHRVIKWENLHVNFALEDFHAKLKTEIYEFIHHKTILTRMY